MHKKRFPVYSLLALLLCITAWACSWLRIEPFFRYSFFPLWLGFILFLDGLVQWRRGTSLLLRMRWRYFQLFLVSSIFWWIFEFLNIPVQNWHYVLDQPYSPLAYFLLSTLYFSTVLPAVMEIAELLSTIKILHPRLPADNPGPRFPPGVFLALEVLGVVCLILPWIYPQYCFGLIWLCLVFLLDPLNNFVGRKSAFAHIAVNDWHFFVLPLATLCCGFFWEMWNYYALPKWYYTIPYVGFFKIFEMPILGYTGYLPFGLELFAMYQFFLFLTRQREDFLAI